MDHLWDKIGAVVAAIITSLGGLYIHDRNTTNKRFNKLETDVAKSKMDIAIAAVRFNELKEDAEEIKQSQKEIIDLLTKRRR